MNCPKCGGRMESYSSGYQADGMYHRYRRCQKCGHRVFTGEQIIRHIGIKNGERTKSDKV